MPSIADQVATIEHDLSDALARIDQLTAANLAFDSANASLRRENIDLQLEINDMKHYVDDTRAMADTLAKSALEMLRASRRHVGPAPDVDSNKPETWPSGVTLSKVYAEKPAPDFGLDKKLAIVSDKWPTLVDAPGWDGAISVRYDENGRATHRPRVTDEPPAQQAVAEIMTGDSGDEQPSTQLVLDHERKTVTVTDLDGRPLPLATVPPANKFEPTPGDWKPGDVVYHMGPGATEPMPIFLHREPHKIFR